MSEVKISCERCDGLGHIPAYRNVMNGECFECDGRGWHSEQTKKEKQETLTVSHKEIKLASSHYVIMINGIEVAEVWKEEDERKWKIEGINKENDYYSTGIHPQLSKKEIVTLFLDSYTAV